MRKLPLFTTLIAFAAADAMRSPAAAEPVAEVVTFKLVAGTDPQAFVAAARGIEPYLRGTGAVISRTLSVDADGIWTDYIVWTSLQAAKDAADALMAQPEAAPMMAVIAADSVTLRHAPILLTMD